MPKSDFLRIHFRIKFQSKYLRMIASDRLRSLKVAKLHPIPLHSSRPDYSKKGFKLKHTAPSRFISGMPQEFFCLLKMEIEKHGTCHS
jgi:hypothetical protein